MSFERLFKACLTAFLAIAVLAISATAGNQTQPTGVGSVVGTAGVNVGTSGRVVTLSADTSVVQHRFTSSCTSGNAMQGADSAGNPSCTSVGTGTVTSVGCGTGLTGGTFTTTGTCAVDNTVEQARISTACGAGQAIQSVNSSGVPFCVSTGGGSTFDPTTSVNYFSDFANTVTTNGNFADGLFIGGFAGTSASTNELTNEQGHPGIIRLNTGTTSTGRASLTIGNNGGTTFLFGAGQFTFDILVRPQTLCDSTTDTCTIACGLIDSVTTADSVDGAYLKFDPVASANWRTVVTSNSTKTEADTSPPVAVAANAWTHLGGVMNSAGTSMAFTINGTAAGTVTTNIPTGAGRSFGFGCALLKSAGTNGRQVDVDYASLTVSGLSR